MDMSVIPWFRHAVAVMTGNIGLDKDAQGIGEQTTVVFIWWAIHVGLLALVLVLLGVSPETYVRLEE